jgi:methionyl-tRNA formyltransferase
MKVLIVTQEDPFYIPLFFEEFYRLFETRRSRVQIEGVVIQRALGKNSLAALARRMLDFYGPRLFLIQGFRFVAHRVKKLARRFGISSGVKTVETLSLAHGVELLPLTDVNSPEFLRLVEDREVDLIVSVAASQIFGKKILATPTHGCINLHNGPLPHYRGMLPNFWQMFHDEEHSILTIHTMTEKLDKGLIVLRQETKIEKDYSFDDLARITKKRSAEALWQVLDQYVAGTVSMTPMPDGKGSYFTFPGKADVRTFRAKGKRIL